MRKFIVCVLVMLMAMTNLVFAKERLVTNVIVTDIDSPFEKTRVLDTDGKVPNRSPYRIYEIAWERKTTGQYEVNVTIVPDIGYIFSGDVGDIEATINGKAVTNKVIVDDDELVISYLFTEKSETSISSDTLKYRIIAYYNSEYGVVSPNGYRVLHGGNQTFKVIPNEGYKIKEVYVDGLNLGPIEEYTFSHVTKSHEIRAFFEEIVEDEEQEENSKAEENQNPSDESQNTSHKAMLQFLLDMIKSFKM